MNIIIGIIRKKEKGKGNRKQGTKTCNPKLVTRNPQPITRNIFEETRFLQLLSLLVLLLVFGGCASRQPVQEDEVSVKSDVKVSTPVIRPVSRFISFHGVTRYMQTNDIRSKLTGIIRQINCSVAGNITVNQPLFVIQPQEAAALQKSKFSSQIINGLSDTVYAHLSGQIKNLNVQVGDFVQIGDVLASCVRANSMRIIAFIPIEQVSLLEKLKDCLVILPDGTSVEGRISGKLPFAESQDQTQAYIIETKKAIQLAEKINLNVQFTAEQIQAAMFVPESAVLGNEEQTIFWVMKLINDTTCIKVPVETGMKKDSLIQLTGSALTATDRVIVEGGYGLPDSARVQVVNKK